MRTTFDLRLVDGTAREPGLVADLRDERRALIFDLGDLSLLPPRVLLRVSHAFVTHCHMDHFAGLDHWLAQALGRVSRLVLWGGPGFVDRVEHKLQAYTWNVVHRYPVPLVLEAHALEADGQRTVARFSSLERFERRDLRAPDAVARAGSELAFKSGPGEVHSLLNEPRFEVSACIVDHEMPVLAFALQERAQVRVAPDRVAAMGFTTGAWLRRLKDAVMHGEPDGTLIEVAWHDRRGAHRAVHRVGELRPLVLDAVPGRRIGYVTDLRFTEPNIERLSALLGDVDVLHIESVFLEADAEHARRKNHLTARQAGEIARRLRARQVVPFHFSPRYRGCEALLREEMIAAWRGARRP